MWKSLFLMSLLFSLAVCTSQNNSNRSRNNNNTNRRNTTPFTAQECSQLTKCGGINDSDTCPKDSSGQMLDCIAGICGDGGLEAGGVCVSTRQACQRTCGSPDCAILESHPAQISCQQ